MLLKTILNLVEKHAGFVYERITLVAAACGNQIDVEVRCRRRSRPVCSGCSRRGPRYDTLTRRRFQYVPLWGIPVFFVYAMRRVNCRRCGVRSSEASYPSEFTGGTEVDLRVMPARSASSRIVSSGLRTPRPPNWFSRGRGVPGWCGCRRHPPAPAVPGAGGPLGRFTRRGALSGSSRSCATAAHPASALSPASPLL